MSWKPTDDSLDSLAIEKNCLMGYTDYLTREERIQRIGQLLSKGITLMLLREAEEKRMAEQQAPTGVRRKNQEEEKTKHEARTAPDGRDENGDSGKQFESSCA